MADLSKLKTSTARRKTLGEPPALDEASNNLTAPEHAPAPLVVHQRPASNETGGQGGYQRRDGRSARKTNRTLAFATRVSEDFDRRFRDVAERDGLLIVELLEKSLDAYEGQRRQDDTRQLTAR